MKRVPLGGFDEYDALTRSRRLYTSLRRAGATDKIKRRYRRRERRTAKANTRKEER